MSEIFRIYLEPLLAAAMTREQKRGAWEAAVLQQGATIVAGGVTVSRLPSGRVMVAGRAER